MCYISQKLFLFKKKGRFQIRVEINFFFNCTADEAKVKKVSISLLDSDSLTQALSSFKNYFQWL